MGVVAVNLYGVWNPTGEKVTRWTAWSGKPVLITEFYVKGMDSGFSNNSGSGRVVPTQKDRGLFYQTFALGLLESKDCVGWQWFKYRDNDPNDKNAEASNRDSNKGMITIPNEPYRPLIDQMQMLNESVYALTDYFDKNAPSRGSAR